MSNTPITAELREYVEENRMGNGMGVETMWGNSVPYDLLQIADRIDAEHKRRMDDMVEVVRCKDCAYCEVHMDGSHVCELTHLAHRDDYYCYFGARREVDD